MAPVFQSSAQEGLFDATTAELKDLGYRNGLLELDYSFPDFFQTGAPKKRIPAAAFGQTPITYKTACFGVLLPDRNGHRGAHLVESCRALGAPLHFEVQEDKVALWVVGHDLQSTRIEQEYSKSQLHEAFKKFTEEWSPSNILRAKNIGQPRSSRQLDFFDVGLIPALEDQIEEKLGPIIRDALAVARNAYKRTLSRVPDGQELFRLVFRLLTGKVLHDADVRGFRSLTIAAGPDIVLQKVADHYRETVVLFLNPAARQAAMQRIWEGLDFTHLSTDILTTIWSKTLVNKRVRRALGIHSTPRTIASYIVNNLPTDSFTGLGEAKGLVVEPCCGSATFLEEAMQRIRTELPLSMSPQERHEYFRKVLVGFETETFGVEIARLCLTLADFPNPNGWKIYEENVFTSVSLPVALKDARVVLCNPPFQTLAVNDSLRAHVESPHKPAEILRRVLLSLHPEGVLGFVLPRAFLDSARYRQARKDLVSRFGDLELVSLPDVAFRESESQHETVLLLATNPRPDGQTCTVRHLRIAAEDWGRFRILHQPTSDDVSSKTIDEAARSLSVAMLGEVWEYLSDLPLLGETSTTSRGMDWILPLRLHGVETGNREKYVLDSPRPPFTQEGVPPRAKINCFQKPETKHLIIRPEDQRRNAYKRPWHLPKVILNASRRSRGPWRISAFADSEGLTCYRTFTAVWPDNSADTTVFAALLNGPVANAFATTQEGFNIQQRMLENVPIPKITERLRKEVEALVAAYQSAVVRSKWDLADATLRKIDASILTAYALPPRLERKLLDLFRGAERPVPFKFGDYFPADFEPYFTLAEWLTGRPAKATVGRFRSQPRELPDHILKAMTSANGENDE